MTTNGSNVAPTPPPRPPRRTSPARWAARILLLVGLVIVAAIALLNTNTRVRNAVADVPGLTDLPVVGDALTAPLGPQQPIDFPHPVHLAAGITCRHCHQYTEVSPVASIMPAERCMQCHTVVAADRPSIQTLRGYYERGEEIPWVRVYNIPGFVYFSHRMHIQAGVSCESCHGNLQEQARTYQANTLNMGFCLSCHRTNNQAPTECYTCHK